MGGLVFLCVIALAADGVAVLLGLPVPGSILGMIALTLWFCWHGSVPKPLADVAAILLRYLPVLLIPVGITAVSLLEAATPMLIKMMVVSVLSVVAAITSTIGVIRVVQWLRRKQRSCAVPQAFDPLA